MLCVNLVKRLLLLACLLGIAACKQPQETELKRQNAMLALTTVEQLAMQPVAAQYDAGMAKQVFGEVLTDGQVQALALLKAWAWLPENWHEWQTDALAAYLDVRKADLLAPTENYLGLSNDPWLQERLLHKLDSVNYGEVDPALAAWLDSQVVAKNVTGYNLSKKYDAPGFKPELTVYYGHSNRLHLRQMLALLAQQSLLAKVALVPKRSVFVYLPEWGEANYGVESVPDGTLLARADEYNLYLGFFSSVDRQHFLSLVQRYAKRDDSGATAVLSASWWQPFVATTTPAKGYHQVYQVVAETNQWQASMMTSNAATQLKSPLGITTRLEPVWVNPALYRYLVGIGHQ